MEGRTADGESITEIQNYLATFNKEIADGGAGAAGEQTILPTSEVEEGEEGTYYVTQTADGTTVQTYQLAGNGHVVGAESTEALLHAVGSGQQGQGEVETANHQPAYVAMQPSHDGHLEAAQEQVVAVTRSSEHGLTMITQVESGEDAGSGGEGSVSAGAQTIRMVVRQPDGTETEQTIPVTGSGTPTLVTSDGQEIHVSDEGTLQMISSFAEQAAAGDGDGNNQLILNNASSYQTVTIVPSDTNPGEVSYVLIVSQPEDKDKGGVDLDMSVYDFNEGEKHAHHGEEGLLAQESPPEQTTKIRTIKVQKKSQTVTQAHMCNYCNYTSPKRYLLSRHMKSHSEERPHKCSVCERGFKTLASLQNHVNTHTGTRPHQCKECEAAFTTSGELVRHVRYKHTHEKPHRCTECDYASVELSKLKRHMRCHTGERPYQCPHCTYASPDTYKLKRHLRIHTGEKPYECDVCHARFTQSNSLKAHKLIHSGNKPVFQCELCPTTCGRKTDLRIHVQKLHTSDKPLKCKRCGKSFPDRYTYKVHVKTHEGEKCFKCDLCAYASISQRHLESHMLIHTDQKPYHCEECGQSFRQKQLLKRHRNLYHDPNYVPPTPKEKTHECPECNKAFRHKGNLIRHLAVHDPEASEAAKEEAMRIGQPKGPGEEHDGEEDDEEYLDDDDMMDDDEGMHGDSGEGQQVVVFEVIQLPASEGASDHQLAQTAAAAMSMATSNGGTTTADGMTIIQQVEGIPEDISAAVSSAVLNPSQGNFSMSLPVVTPRRRGRPRKYPLPVERSIPDTTALFQNRQLRTRKPTEHSDMVMDDDEDYQEEEEDEIITSLLPVRRGPGRPPKRPRGRPPKIYPPRVIMEEVEAEDVDDRLTVAEAAAAVTPVITDPEELARHEQEMTRRRLEQKQKDMAECFGFNDDEDDEDDKSILELSGAPTVTIVNGDASDGHHYS